MCGKFFYSIFMFYEIKILLSSFFNRNKERALCWCCFMHQEWGFWGFFNTIFWKKKNRERNASSFMCILGYMQYNISIINHLSGQILLPFMLLLFSSLELLKQREKFIHCRIHLFYVRFSLFSCENDQKLWFYDYHIWIPPFYIQKFKVW